MRDPSAQIETLRERVQDSEQVSNEDAQKLLEFSDRLRLLKSEYGDYRHEKLLRHCIRMAEEAGKLALALEDRESAEEIVRWINREYDNEETNHDYRIALRIFGKRVTPSKDLPESLAWIPTGYSRNYDPKPRPSEMLRWEEDVQPMIEATMNSRDAALIATAFDAGPRSEELRTLTIGDISDGKHGPQITVDGKTGQRTVTLFLSGPRLQRWLSDHPARNNSNAPLWSKLQTAEQPTYQLFLNIFKSAAKRASIDKPVSPTNFRKSSASFLASRGLNQATLEDHHGWVRGSDVAARYVSVFSEDADRQLAKAHGVEIEEDTPDQIAPLDCPRCSHKTPRENDFCAWCGKALRPEAEEELQKRERSVRDAVFRLVQKDPEILTERERITDLLTLVEESPDLLNDAERFLAALESSN